MSLRVLVPALLGMFGIVCHAAPQPAVTAVPVTTVEGITEYRLPNGLHFLLVPDNSKKAVSVSVTYKAGSRMEGPGKSGMAHLLEHMMFKGTPKRPNLYQEFSAHGLTVTGDTNAFTLADRTFYFESFPASETALEWALEMEADRMMNARIVPKELDPERRVVCNELEGKENNPYLELFYLAQHVAFRSHPYGLSAAGACPDVTAVSVDDLRSFYQTYYQPDNAVLIVAGAFDTKQTVGWIEKHFGVIQRPSRVLPTINAVEPPQEGERAVVLRRAGENKSFTLLYHIPPAQHPDMAALSTLAQLYSGAGGRVSARITGALRAPSIAMEAYDPGLFVLELYAAKGADSQKMRQQLLQAVEGVGEKPFTEAEVTRARKARLAVFDLTMDDPNVLSAALSSGVGIGDWRYFFWLRQQLAKVTVEDVNRVATTYMKPNNRTLGEFNPQDAPGLIQIPERTNLTEVLQALSAQSSVTEGENFDTSPANLDKHTIKYEFPNGMKLAMLPKRTRGGKVRVSMEIQFGDKDGLADQGVMINLMPKMLFLGTRRHTGVQLAQLLNESGALVSITSNGQRLLVKLDSHRERLASDLDIVREILLESTFPQSPVNRAINAAVANRTAQDHEPVTLAQLALNRYLNSYPAEDPRAVLDANVYAKRAALIRDENAVDFWQQYVGGDHAWIGIVGDFDNEAVRRQLQEAFGGWHAAKPYAPLPVAEFGDADTRGSDESKSQLIDVPNKQSAELRGGIRLALKTTDRDDAAMRIAVELLGGGFMNSRLATRLRQQDGLSYSVSTGLETYDNFRRGYFTLAASFAPQNRGRVEQAVREEVARVHDKGFTAAELQEARTALLLRIARDRENDKTLADQLVANQIAERGFVVRDQQDRWIEQVSLAELNEVSHRYFDPDRLHLYFAGSFGSDKP